VKTVKLGVVEGDQPRGRPARRWSDDVTGWCDDMWEAVRLATDKDEWRRITGLNGPRGWSVQKKKKKNIFCTVEITFPIVRLSDCLSVIHMSCT